MGFSFLGDENLDPAQEFERCEKGTHKLCNISKWITADDDGTPVWTYDEFRQDLVARCEFARVDGGAGPAWSGTPLDFLLLVSAFGGDIKTLPKKRNTTEFLVKAEESILKADGVVTAEVNDGGWVSFIKEATPPEGYYQFKFAEARSADGSTPLTFQENTYGNEQVVLLFEVVGNMLGTPVVYNGFRVSHYLQNGFDGTHQGRPNLLLTEKGAKSYAARRAERFAAIFAPDVLEADYVWRDPDNPIAEIVDAAVDAERLAVGHYTYNNPKPPRKPRLVLDFDSLAPVDDADSADTPPDEAVDTDVPPNLYGLVEWIHEGCDTAFKKYPPKTADEIELTAEGQKWARKNMARLMLDAGLEPRGKPLSLFTEEECAALLKVIWSSFA